jgi:hypothetical protein
VATKPKIDPTAHAGNIALTNGQAAMVSQGLALVHGLLMGDSQIAQAALESVHEFVSARLWTTGDMIAVTEQLERILPEENQ